MSSQGVCILDADRRIELLTSGAEDLLGWRTCQVAGLACSLVLDCRDARGESLCDRCPSADALEQGEVTAETTMEMVDPAGERRSMRTSFWYLPPAGTVYHPRIMAVLHATPT
jgi:hypothetical protein